MRCRRCLWSLRFQPASPFAASVAAVFVAAAVIVEVSVAVEVVVAVEVTVAVEVSVEAAAAVAVEAVDVWETVVALVVVFVLVRARPSGPTVWNTCGGAFAIPSIRLRVGNCFK